jgi:hypothetical protein
MQRKVNSLAGAAFYQFFGKVRFLKRIIWLNEVGISVDLGQRYLKTSSGSNPARMSAAAVFSRA